MATKLTSEPTKQQYVQKDWSEGYEYNKELGGYFNETQYNADAASWTSFQGDLESMKNNSKLQIELGETQAPKKATDPTESKADYTKLSTGVSSALGIPTGVQV